MEHCLEKVEGDVVFRSAYLAISPPVGFVTRLATMSFSGPSSASIIGDVLFTLNPALVIYGDQDGFISHKKIHEWIQQLSSADASRFRHVEVRGAGHFWIEGDVIYQCEFLLISSLHILTLFHLSFSWLQVWGMAEALLT